MSRTILVFRRLHHGILGAILREESIRPSFHPLKSNGERIAGMTAIGTFLIYSDVETDFADYRLLTTDYGFDILLYVMKIPLVKEWGSWVVFGASCLAALAAGLSTQQWEASGDALGSAVTTIAGLFCLINTKPSLSAAIRGKSSKRPPIVWFLIFCAGGLFLMAPLLRSGIERFAPFLLLAVTYVLFMRSGKEHHIMAELNGFALLTASAPVVYFAITGMVSMKLYGAVLFFFAAGVLKVRVRTRKTLFHRVLMIAYCAVVLNIYHVLRINLILLVPFAENIISALWMREEKLRTTGYTEFAKSILFVVLTGIFWNQ